MGKPLTNIIKLQEFSANPDEEILIGASEIAFLMPIFRRCEDRYIDATGDYDLCMSLDGLKFVFINRRATPEVYAYRYFSLNWLANRLQK